MDDQLLTLYHRHVGSAFERQQRLTALLEKQTEGEWVYDSAAATLTYGKLKFEAPILGTHAANGSWVWATANKNLRLTVTNRALVDTARTVAHRLGVHALGAPAFALEPLLGSKLLPSAAHVLGVIYSTELGYDAFYASPYEGGRQLALLRSDKLKAVEKRPLLRVAMTFPAAVKEMDILDHKAALVGYAKDYALHVTDIPGGLKITGDGKDELTATFDAAGRLAKLEGIAIPAPPPPPPKKPAKAAKPTAKKAAKPARKATAKKAAPKPAVKKAAAKTTAKRQPAKKVAAKKVAAKKAAGKKR